MLENFIKAIVDFFKSPEFTATVAGIAVIWNTIIWPVLKKRLNAKTQIKIESALAKAKAATKENKYLKEKYLEVCAYVPKINEMLAVQAEALRTAFNNSNLKADVKELIENKLTNIKPIELPKLEDEEEENTEQDETETVLAEDEIKNEANPSTEIVL